MEITFRNEKYCLEKMAHKDLMDFKFLLESIKVDLKNDLIVLENQRNPKAPKEEVQILKYKNHKIGLNIHAINYELNKRRERDKNFAQKKAIDTYNRGSGVRPTDDNMKLIQANNMLIDMAKWGKFRTAEKKHYTCECKYKESSDDEPIKIIEIGVCPNKDPENIRLCKLSTKIWDKLLNSMEDRRTFKNAWYEISDNYEDMAHYCEINTELRAIVFKTLVEESLKRD